MDPTRQTYVLVIAAAFLAGGRLRDGRPQMADGASNDRDGLRGAMRLVRAIGLLAWIRFRRWDRAWKERATLLDNVALAALVAAATYKMLTVLW